MGCLDEDVEQELGTDGSKPTGKDNYGIQIQGPWVLGLYQSTENIRFVLVSDRKSECRYC